MLLCEINIENLTLHTNLDVETIYLCSYECLRNILAQKALNMFEIVVFDEAQKLKSLNTSL